MSWFCILMLPCVCILHMLTQYLCVAREGLKASKTLAPIAGTGVAVDTPFRQAVNRLAHLIHVQLFSITPDNPRWLSMIPLN